MIKMKQIILDSNLLVLLIVGLTDTNLIPKHKRTKSYEKEDFELLASILSNYDQVVVTPHILTETSNLVSQIGEPVMSLLRKTLLNLLEVQKEEYQPSIDIGKHTSFLRLGLTDCAILSIIKSELPLLTVDLDLYLMAAKKNKNTVNFNHLREPRLLSNH